MRRHLDAPDLLDRRARLAAAHLLLAFDLPAEAMAASWQMIEAAEACPGCTMGDFPAMGNNQRRTCLERARTLIDEMLAEAP
ncbi:hypothetical protein [Novosphingobium sp.]|uniref:hypothetical protein n=1 Tax=Novosphingobium sp. TaxID=1874826 RepID=UPI0026351EF1|nr:hypothetical protein [Novosphingobium sp.]